MMFRLGSEWMLTPYRLAVYLPTKTAVIADPHLGYRDARRRCGDAIPIASPDDELALLKTACAALDLVDIVVAGDLCEAWLDGDLIATFTNALDLLHLRLRAIVPGNHDRGWGEFRDQLPFHADGVQLGRWTVHHGDRAAPSGPSVMGHVHPAWRTTGETQPCYLIRPHRIVLPAFSLDAAGGAVNCDPRWRGYQSIAIAGERLVDHGVLGDNVGNEHRPRRRGLRGRLS
jgi:metallophosphoesterase superfamily enzyme